MILGLWLDQPVWLMFTLLAGVFLAICAGLSLLTNLPWTKEGVRRLAAGIVPPYIAVVAVLLALLTGFVANDAWERQRQASRVVQAERSHALAVYDLSIASAPDMSGLRTALFAYLEAVVTEEWPSMAATGASAPNAGQALGRLLQVAADPRNAKEAGEATHAALLDAVMQLRSARSERLALSSARSDESKWLTLLVLAALTLTAIALVHCERPLAQGATLFLFSAAMVTTLGVVALHERPFDGPLALSPEPIRLARAAMEAGTR
ncbi:bestrophin-like domain [Methylorubrum aminovorans]